MIESNKPIVSVIIPCLNEEKYLANVLANMLSQDYPKDNIEILIVDGGSSDSTVQIANTFCKEHAFIHLLNNPARYVPHAMNLAIRASKGTIIVRIDAHSLYPSNYISRLVEALDTTDADNTGGMWITEAASDSPTALAISQATSHPFGIGNATYRLGSAAPKYVDTVPYGCYRRSLFNRIGFFDEHLVRNQDDEFNARLIANGGKILLLADVKIRYFAREKISKMSTMFYQYGLFKPLVNVKLGKPATIRQLFPPALVAGLLSTIILSIFWFPLLYLFVFEVIVYLIPVLFFSLKLGYKKGIFSKLMLIFPAIHFSYGWGYLRGIVHFVIRRKKSIRI